MPNVYACLKLRTRPIMGLYTFVFLPAGVFLSLFDVDVFVSLVTSPANDCLAERPITPFTFVFYTVPNVGACQALRAP